ncbi:DNA helicase [Tanacetum coccineum]
MVQGETTTYLSHDEATPLEHDGAETEMLYHIEHLNTLKFLGFSPHRLELKVGAPVMLLRNVNVDGGLCNDIRMIVRQMMMKLIERRQFPIKLCYAMTNNKSHGQSLSKIDVYLPEPIFGHGQMFSASMELSTFTQLTPASHDKIIEARVYRKWIGKSLTYLTPNAFCCILLDREGNAIQANMSLKDIDYFNPKLQMGSAYRSPTSFANPPNPINKL